MSARAAAFFLFFLALASVVHGDQRLRVPSGFVVEKVAAGPETRFPMFAAWDRRGRLFIAESSGLDLYAELIALTRKCQVRMLEDRDGDGRFEHSTIFAERLVFPMGLVWRDDKLYVADPPELVTLEDKDGDGVADERITVLTGFGHRDNGSLHGLIFGPDDALYMTMGQPDGYRLRRGDGSFLEGTSGALIRSRRDGSEPHVIARGFENLVEIIFTSSGEIIGTDNWFQKPSGGIRDALVHLVDGGLYPYAADRGTPQPVTGSPLPPLALFPAVALSGLEIARSSAWPEAMRGNLFSAQHNSRKVARHVLQRDGASFRADSFDFVTTDDPDIHFSDILEDADGSLLLVDTGSWYVQHCPTGRIRNAPSTGAIYRVRRGDAPKTVDPWGREENWSTATTARLLELLADSRTMVRGEAQRNLRARLEAAGKEVIAFAKNSNEPGPRQLALWTLTSSRGAATADLHALLHDETPEIVATTARVLAALRDRSAAEELHRLLRHRAPPVRLAAAEALVHCGNEETLPHLWEALSNAPDRFIEHALVHAAHWLASEKQLHGALAHAEPQVQRAALQLLAQSPRAPSALSADLVLKKIAAPDASLRETALTILRNRRDWAKEAIALVDAWCRKERRDTVVEEHRTAFRELTIAFQNEPEIQNAIAVALASASAETRMLALETAKRCMFEQAPRAWINPIRNSLSDPDGRVRQGAVRAAISLRMTTLDDTILRIANAGEEPIDLRLEACDAATRQNKLAAPLFDFLVHQLRSVNEPLRRLLAAEQLSRCRLSDKQAARVLKAVAGEHLISPSKFVAAFQWSESNESSVELVEAVGTALGGGWTPAPGELDQLAERLPASARARAAALRERTHATSEDARARLARFSPMIAGGSAEAGAEIFFQSRAACAACHAIGTQGGKFGPDLTKIGAIRSPQDILESIVLPSATFAQGYGTFQITATDDTVAIGVISEQNLDTVTLREPSGNERNFARKQIKKLTALPLSMMPENLLAALSDAEIRDLLAFLQQLR